MERKTSWTVAAVGTLGLLCALGCGDKEWTRTPDGFVKVEDSAFAYKAVSPDGSTIVVRHRENAEEGSLAFWAEVFTRELVEAKGYRAAGTADVTSADGVAGRLMRFEVAAGDVSYHYGVALYVTPKSIVTVETATELSELARYQPAFDAARSDLKVKAAE